MIVDTSAVVAILFDEPEADTMFAAISAADQRAMSTVAYLEVAMVVDGDAGRRMSEVDGLLGVLGIEQLPFTSEQARVARDAFNTYGKGMGTTGARLNFGDCMTYALAKTTGRALLYKGGDFAKTDIAAALPA